MPDQTNNNEKLQCTVLIVDDSAVTRAAIKRTLVLAGLPATRIFEAPHGKAALEVLDHVSVDLVLADLQMPEMDGVEMTRRILANPATRHTPVVVVSADPSVEKIEQLKRDGIRGYVRKPFTPEQIRDGIRQALATTPPRAAA